MKAMKAQRDGDWFKAVSRYFKAVNTLKTGGDIKTEFLHQNQYDCLVYSQLASAHSYRQLKEFDSAQEMLDQILSVEPNCVEALLLQCKILLTHSSRPIAQA